MLSKIRLVGKWRQMCKTIFWNCPIKYPYSFLDLYVRAYWGKAYNMCKSTSSFNNDSSTVFTYCYFYYVTSDRGYECL